MGRTLSRARSKAHRRQSLRRGWARARREGLRQHCKQEPASAVPREEDYLLGWEDLLRESEAPRLEDLAFRLEDSLEAHLRPRLEEEDLRQGHPLALEDLHPDLEERHPAVHFNHPLASRARHRAKGEDFHQAFKDDRPMLARSRVIDITRT